MNINNIDYKQLYLDTIIQSGVYTLPNKEILQSDEDVLFANWKSYISPSFSDSELSPPFDFLTWFQEGNWAEILNCPQYKTNYPLWEKLIAHYSEHNPQNVAIFIHSLQFATKFPEAQNYLKTNEKLMSHLFVLSGEQELLKHIPIDDDKYQKLLESHHLQKDFTDASEFIKEQEKKGNIEFIKILLQKKHYMFSKISPELQNNVEIIPIVIEKNKESFYLLNSENQDKFFDIWFKKFKPYISSQEFLSNSPEIQKKIILKEPIFLNKYPDTPKHNQIIKEILIEHQNSFDFIVPFINQNKLSAIFQDSQFIDKFTPFIEQKTQNTIELHYSKNRDLYLLLAKKIPTIKERLDNDFFFQFCQEKRFSLNVFHKYCKEFIKMYQRAEIDDATIDKILNHAHLKLFIEDKKILRLSKENLLPNLSKKYFQEDLEEKLNSSSSKQNKFLKV